MGRDERHRLVEGIDPASPAERRHSTTPACVVRALLLGRVAAKSATA
jgi:hypothetical protein